VIHPIKYWKYTPLVPTRCWSDTKPASGTAAATPYGHAGHATEPCTGRPSTLTARHLTGLPQCGSRLAATEQGSRGVSESQTDWVLEAVALDKVPPDDVAAAHTRKGCPLVADQPFRPRPGRLRRSKISKYAQSWALVTGAAREQPLGYAFARQLAVEGLSLLLVDILDEGLHPRAKELRRQFGVDVRTATCDLGAHAPLRVHPFLFGPAADRFAGGQRAPSRALRRRYRVHNSSSTPWRPRAEVSWPGPKVRGKCSTGIHDIAAAAECRFGLVRSRHRVASPWYVLQAVSVWISFEGQSVSLFESLH
jgi:hypothetical protein